MMRTRWRYHTHRILYTSKLHAKNTVSAARHAKPRAFVLTLHSQKSQLSTSPVDHLLASPHLIHHTSPTFRAINKHECHDSIFFGAHAKSHVSGGNLGSPLLEANYATNTLWHHSRAAKGSCRTTRYSRTPREFDTQRTTSRAHVRHFSCCLFGKLHEL
jgi:hypothetical protein